MDVAQPVELLVVVQAVAGSNPVVHPEWKCLQVGSFAHCEFGRTAWIRDPTGHERAFPKRIRLL